MTLHTKGFNRHCRWQINSWYLSMVAHWPPICQSPDQKPPAPSSDRVSQAHQHAPYHHSTWIHRLYWLLLVGCFVNKYIDWSRVHHVWHVINDGTSRIKSRFVPLTRITLGVLVVHTGTQSLQNSSARKVLGCYELQAIRLSVLLLFYDAEHLKHKCCITQGTNGK